MGKASTVNVNTPVGILVVDDEPQIVNLSSQFLDLAGFKTFRAYSAEDALAVWRDHPSEIDLLLTDCAMPGLFGDQLALRLLQEKPDLKVIFMSGNPPGSLELAFDLEEHVNFIHKPFEFGELVRFIKRILSGEIENVLR